MPSKQRIAFVANTSWSIYKFRLYLLQTLVAKGFDVYVLAPRDKYTDFFEHIEGISFVELKKLKGKSISLLDDLQLYFELLGHYKRLRPRIVFHYTIKANIYGSLAAARIKCPAIAVITGLGYTFSGNSFLKLAASKLYGYALRKTKEVWFLNRDDKNVFINDKLVAAEKAFLLPGEGVDAAAFYPVPFSNEEKIISFLLIGRLIEHKGIYEYATAAKILLAKGLHVQFCLLGFFDNKSAVAISKEQLQQWQREKSITYLGDTDNVVPFVANADCIVLPSYREGMPLSLLEGASMCKALVASDVAGCREVVKNEINGFLCREKDADDLAAKMEQYYYLAAKEKTAMGIAGRDFILSHFTKEIITEIYLSKLETFTK